MQFWFLKKKTQVYSIQKASVIRNKTKLIQNITKEIQEIDQKLAAEIKELMQTQAVGLKTALSKNKNWFDQLQKKIYWSRIKESLFWHRDQIIFLYREKRKLQIQLDRLNGRVWAKRIRSWIAILTLCIISFFAVWIVFMGIITTLYLLPLLVLVLVSYLFFQRISNKI